VATVYQLLFNDISRDVALCLCREDTAHYSGRDALHNLECMQLNATVNLINNHSNTNTFPTQAFLLQTSLHSLTIRTWRSTVRCTQHDSSRNTEYITHTCTHTHTHTHTLGCADNRNSVRFRLFNNRTEPSEILKTETSVIRSLFMDIRKIVINYTRTVVL
jgi:hypothetical protein